jgi:hypothetical protein
MLLLLAIAALWLVVPPWHKLHVLRHHLGFLRSDDLSLSPLFLNMFKKALDVFVCVCHLFECVQKMNVFKKERVMGTAFQNDPLEDVSVEEESAVVEQVKEGAEEGRDKNLARKWYLAFFFVGLGIVTSV